MQRAATGLAGVLGELTLLAPGDELGLAVRAAHMAGGLQCDDAFVAGCRGDRGRFEGHGVALAASHCAGWAATFVGGCCLAGDEGQGTDGHEAGDDVSDEFRFHSGVVLG